MIGRRQCGQFLAGVGIALVAGAALGLMIIGARLVLPRGWVLTALAHESKPTPFVALGTRVAPPPPSKTTVPPTPDFSLGANVPRLYYLWIPRLGLYAPVIAVSQRPVEVQGQTFWQLDTPNAFAVGWSASSAPVGQPGNTVFVGHNNEFGDVFKDLWYLAAGDEIVVQADAGDRQYVVSEVAYFEERDRPLEERLTNAQWIAPTSDERLTLLTCWPYYTNTHRLIVTALPQG